MPVLPLRRQYPQSERWDRLDADNIARYSQLRAVVVMHHTPDAPIQGYH